MKKIFLLSFLTICLMSSVKASHFMGGEIWWTCLPDGKYLFHVRLFQECYGIDYGQTETMECVNVPGLNSFPVNLVSVKDLTPTCNSNPIFPHITCDGVTGANQGGFKEWYYESAPVTLPSYTINTNGWIFVLNICNRNACTNIINATQYCGCLRAVMYPYNNQPVGPCMDNSPVFIEEPVLVSPTGYPQTLYQDAFDAENDSISYIWAQPWQNNGVPITTYAPGYSYTSPLPGTLQNSLNIPAVLDPVSGDISYTSYTQGAFIICVKASAYKNGILVAEVFKEMQMVLINVNWIVINSPPVPIDPFPNNTADPWVDTVNIGELIHVQLGAFDSNFLNDSVTPQSVTLTAQGTFLGDGDTNAALGCPVPPCATLNVSTPVTGTIVSTVEFDWQPNINHLLYQNYPTTDKEFLFFFNFKDDYCPVPYHTRKKLKIVLKNPSLPPPVMTSYIINSVNFGLTVYWDPIQDSLGYFDKYYIYYKNSIAGSFQLADSIENINQNLYTFSQPVVPGQWFWCEMRTKTVTSLSGSSNILTNYVVGDDESNALTDIQISWIPGDQSVLLNGFLDQGRIVSIDLTDCLGISHHHQVLRLESGQILQKIPVNLTSPGVYFCKIQDNNEKVVSKLMIIRRSLINH